MKKLEKGRMVLLGVLAIWMMQGCFSDNHTNSVKQEVPEEEVSECNVSIPESGIHFDISGVEYAAISAVSLDETNSSLMGARQLASQCAQCHGTQGVSVGENLDNWPSLWGTGRKIAKTMNDYNDTLYEQSAMHIHSSMTYTQEQIQLIKTYYETITYEGGE